MKPGTSDNKINVLDMPEQANHGKQKITKNESDEKLQYKYDSVDGL